MTVTVTREQRDAIYQEVLTDLSGVGDIWVAIEHENYEEARESRRRFELDMRLLDDLGWDRVDDRKTFALSMPTARLAEVVRHLNANAGSELRHHINRPFEGGGASRALAGCFWGLHRCTRAACRRGRQSRLRLTGPRCGGLRGPPLCPH